MFRTVIKCIGFMLVATFPIGNGADTVLYKIDCNNLLMGQYICPHPDYDLIDIKTQQPRGCNEENKATGKTGKTRFCHFSNDRAIIN